MPKRITFYIDGFNFYHGLKAAIEHDPNWKKCYWLDFVKFAQQFTAKNQELIAVKYFTAQPLEAGKQSRQAALFNANKLLNGDKLQLINGKYYKKKIKCQAECGKRFWIHEEKRTNVNISVELMGDCAFDKTDILVLISADSDLVPTVEYIQNAFHDLLNYALTPSGMF